MRPRFSPQQRLRTVVGSWAIETPRRRGQAAAPSTPFSACQAEPIAFQVTRPTTPSTAWLSAFWKARTAVSVTRPQAPSCATWTFAWTILIVTPATAICLGAGTAGCAGLAPLRTG